MKVDQRKLRRMIVNEIKLLSENKPNPFSYDQNYARFRSMLSDIARFAEKGVLDSYNSENRRFGEQDSLPDEFVTSIENVLINLELAVGEPSVNLPSDEVETYLMKLVESAKMAHETYRTMMIEMGQLD